MISETHPELRRLHVAAVEALAQAGITGTLLEAQDESDLHELSRKAFAEHHGLHVAWMVAHAAGVQAPVEAITDPARLALEALIDELRIELGYAKREEGG